MKIKRITPKKRRTIRVRSQIFGTATTPRLSVFRSAQHLLAQLIDDAQSRTLVGLSTQGLKHLGGGRAKRSEASDSREVNVSKMNKTEQAKLLGELIAKKAQELKITSAVFDRGDKRYHGRLQALAEAARAHGLKI